MWDTLVRPSADRSAAFLADGLWRDETILDDLDRAVQAHPDKHAIISYAGGVLARTVDYRELGVLVDRFAAALLELGVRRRDVVAIHLPNWWMLGPLYLACSRIGAIPTPVVPALGPRELGYVLAHSGAKVCVVADQYNGVDYRQRLDDAAPTTLAHRVVVRAGATEAAAGVIDFDDFFVNTPWEQRHQLAEVAKPAADDIALLLFTSGTTGAPKAVVHSYNTLYAAAIALPNSASFGPETVVTVPHYQTHMAGLIFAAYLALVLGGTSVMQDDSDMALMLDMIARHGVTFGYSAPAYVVGMVAAQRKQPRDLSSLKYLISGSAPIPPQLISDVADSLGVELGALWGMTENGPVTVTRPDDPVGWAAHSDGSLVPGSELRIDAEPGEEIGRLLVRGPSQCLGYLNQREVYERCLDEDGWFDTGDLARPDGRHGIRIIGRRDDLIIRRMGNKVPTLEVEAVILRHPQVREVALIGFPDLGMPGADRLCAVIVPDGPAPTIEELKSYLDGLGMTWWNWPERIELRQSLPKNSLGKVQRSILREELKPLAAEYGDELDGSALFAH